jgi:hypothetical protein
MIGSGWEALVATFLEANSTGIDRWNDRMEWTIVVEPHSILVRLVLRVYLLCIAQSH